MSDDDHPTVEAELTLDDQASKVLEHVKAGFDALKDKAKETVGEIGGILRDGLSHAVGIQISGAFDTLKGFIEGSLDEALGTGREQKSIQSVLQILDQEGASWQQLGEDAAKYHAELGTLSQNAYQLQEDLVDAFDKIAYRTGKGADEVLRLTENLSLAGRAVPGGTAALTQAFAEMENGAIRAKNPIVQLLKASNMMEGSGKAIAKELQTLFAKDPGKVMEMADEAVGRMAKKMKDVPPTFDEMITSMKEAKADILEQVGLPILQALQPQLEKLRQYLLTHADSIQAYAKAVGEKIGKWVVEAAEYFKKGFEFLQNHADEIRRALEDGWKIAKEVVDFIISNKETLMVIFGVKKSVSTLRAGLGDNLVGMGAKMGIEGGFSQFVGGLGVATAGLIALSTATKIATDIMAYNNEVEATKQQAKQNNTDYAQAGMTNVLKNQFSTQTKVLEAMSERIVNIGNGASVMDRGDYVTFSDVVAQVQKLVDLQLAFTEAQANAAKMSFEGSKKAWKGLSDAANDVNQAFEDLGEGAFAAASDFNKMMAVKEADLIVEAYNVAAKRHDEAAQKSALSMLVGNQVLQDAILQTGDEVEGGMRKMATLFKEFETNDGADNFSRRLGSMAIGTGKNLGVRFKPEKPEYNININNVNIQQDFRDADPDRVAIVFRRDLMNMAEHRRQALGSIASGL